MKKFKAKINADGEGGSWPTLTVPFDVKKEFGTGARVSVRGTINGFEFRTSIFPDGKGHHLMMVNKAMRTGAGAEVGDTVSVAMEQDTEEKKIEIPEELTKALNKNKFARAAFEKMPPSHKREYAGYILEAKKAETRERRVEKAIEMIIEWGETKIKK